MLKDILKYFYFKDQCNVIKDNENTCFNLYYSFGVFIFFIFIIFILMLLTQEWNETI